MKFPAFLLHETAQCFGVTVGAVWWLWSKGAPESVLWMVTGLGLAYIVGEKVRSIFHPRRDDG